MMLLLLARDLSVFSRSSIVSGLLLVWVIWEDWFRSWVRGVHLLLCLPLPVDEQRLIPARVRSEWARLESDWLASNWAPASQDSSHVGNSGWE